MRGIALILFMYFFACQPAAGQQDIYTTPAGAIEGYDPVAYFTEGEAVRGDEQFQFEWSGATWYFASEGNRSLFREDPEKYAPQYGGYCAYAMADGKKVKVDPEAWTIADGKLYLNYSRRIQDKWQGDRDAYISQANQHWSKME